MSARNRIVTSHRMDFLLGQPSRVPKCFVDVFCLDIWVILKDFVHRRPVRNLPDNDRNGDAHSTNTGTSTHDPWVKCNSFEHRGHLLKAMRIEPSMDAIITGSPFADNSVPLDAPLAAHPSPALQWSHAYNALIAGAGGRC